MKSDVISTVNDGLKVQFIPEQHRFELYGPTYMQNILEKNIWFFFLEICEM